MADAPSASSVLDSRRGATEVFGDSNFGKQLGRLIGDARVRLEEAAFATGNTGATIPRGVVAAVAAITASIVTSAATNAFAIGDVYRVHNATTPRADQKVDLHAGPAVRHVGQWRVLVEPRRAGSAQ
jgi:hypothetical protein